MRASRRLWMVAFVSLLSFGLSTVTQAQSQVMDQALVERVLGPQWKQLSRRAGTIFAGTVLSGSAAGTSTDHAVPWAPPFSIELSSRVDRAIAGVERGQALNIREWAGAASMHRPMSGGQKVLLFLYPLSQLGLTSPVEGSLGVIVLDAGGEYVPGEKLIRRDRMVSRAGLPVPPSNGPGGPPGGGSSSSSSSSQPVLLGSSQAQVVTSQDGIASIMPSAQNVGPCDVFVAARAGNSSMQFQLENLAAMVPVVPVGRPKPGIFPREVSVGLAAPAVVVAPLTVFSVPEGDAGAESAPGSHTGLTERPAGEVSGASTTEATPGEKSVSRTGARVKIVGFRSEKKRSESQRKVAASNDASGSVRSAPGDKRSCRALAEDGIVF